jgi:MULE transposase domain
MENGKLKIIHQHIHEKETRLSIVDKFRKILTKKAIETSKPLVDIYLEETLNFTEASILYPFSLAESTMRKARAKHKPKVNKIFDIMGEDSLESHHQHQLQKHYCQEVLENGTTLVLMHQHSVKLLGKIEEIHVDCSISCKSPEGELHLITVLAMAKYQEFPIAFGLVKQRNLEVFSSFFQHIREKASTFLPNIILTSCDINLQEALKLSFPDATVKIMWFFYASSVLKFAKESDLLKLMNNSLFHKISIKMILGLPLIPANYMIPGFDALKKWMFEKSVHEFNLLCEYIEFTWLSSDNAEKLSIFNGLSLLNNYIQNFNRDLLNSQSVEDLTKEKLLEAISKQATRTIAKLNKIKGTPSLKKSQKLQKNILEKATQNWIKANIHLRRPIQFLQQVSHCIDEGMINFLLNYDLDKKTETFAIQRFDSAFSDFNSTPLPSPAPSVLLTEPPPLIFFHQPKLQVVKKIVTSEPPPLIPIVRKSSTNGTKD